ncbi:HNH endonuclease [Calothrix membranacea FACHB-236]|nr:HNH endonuclease [Calothrix membranacea FACHB-236]
MLVLEPSRVVFSPNYLPRFGMKRVKLQNRPSGALLRRGYHSCQDDGRNKPFTLKPVIWRSHGGHHQWNNLVIACKKSHPYKGNCTPRMHLRNQPKPPVYQAISIAEEFWINMQANLEQQESRRNVEINLH